MEVSQRNGADIAIQRDDLERWMRRTWGEAMRFVWGDGDELRYDVPLGKEFHGKWWKILKLKPFGKR